LRCECGIERLIHRQTDLVLGRDGILVLRFGRKRRAGDQVVSSSKVANELGNHCPDGGTLIDNRVVQPPAVILLFGWESTPVRSAPAVGHRDDSTSRLPW